MLEDIILRAQKKLFQSLPSFSTALDAGIRNRKEVRTHSLGYIATSTCFSAEIQKPLSSGFKEVLRRTLMADGLQLALNCHEGPSL